MAAHVVKRAASPVAEDRLIADIEALWENRANPGVMLAGGDDCAVISPPGPGEEWLLTTDQVIENRHFVADRHTPGALGWKALARSLSDIAAMGGRPLYFLQAVCLPDWALGAWHASFQQGLRAMADQVGACELSLVGGDVAGGDRFSATVTVIGCVERGTALRRSGARPGDTLCVSGSLGGSALGLEMLLNEPLAEPDHSAVRRHCRPQPRLALGRALRAIPATAAVDLSDGLAIDANRLARASGVAVTLDAESVPVFPGAQLDQALRSGEEYELLFTLGPESDPPIGFDATRIGVIEQGSGAWLQSGNGRVPLGPEGFSHF